MEPPVQISCSGNCLVHLHSAAGKAWLKRNSCPFQQQVGPDGITRFRDRFRLHTNNSFLSAYEMFTSIFQRQIAVLERLHGQRVQNIIALIPAPFNSRDYQSALSTIAAAAGVRIVNSIERSVLAASAYTSLNTPERRTVLVFELGGQFLEISLLTEDQDRGLNILAVVSNLGCPLLNLMVPRRSNIDSESESLLLHYTQLQCERAKDALCLGSTTVDIKIEQLGIERIASINREWLVQMNLNHLRIGIMRCLMKAGVRKEAVDEVVLAGASSNIPEVRGVLLEFFQEHKFRCSINPASLMVSSSQQFTNNISSILNIPVTIFEGLNLGMYAL